MELEGYENRFVAFIDILGFKELINSIENKDKYSDKTLDRIKSILNFLHSESLESNGQHDLPIYEKVGDVLIEKELGDPRISYISDCVIISTEGTFEGFKSLCNKITKFSTDIACDGIFIRGAITYGQLYHHGPILFGSAYQNAYKLESTYANSPRVIIDKIVFDILNERIKEFPLTEPTIMEDTDKFRYLSNFPYQYYPQYIYSWIDFLLRVKSKILYNLNLFDNRVSGFSPELKNLDKFCCWKESYGYDLDFTGGHKKVLDKYIWLSKEFNHTLKTYKRFLSNNEKMRISEIVWNGKFWSPKEELGHQR